MHDTIRAALAYRQAADRDDGQRELANRYRRHHHIRPPLPRRPRPPAADDDTVVPLLDYLAAQRPAPPF